MGGCNGASTVMVFSIAQINTSMGGNVGQASELLALIAMSGVAGRIVIGMAQDKSVRKCRMPRSIFMMLGLIFLGISQLFLAWAPASLNLKIGVVVASVVFGMSWCVLGALTLDMFGNTNYY